MIFWLAPVDREMLSGHLSGLICYGNTSILIEKGQKRSRMDAWESVGK